ncbi:hypothetical protein [Parvularcula sp. IMCC14364]|uniref:hypothetical protein n=1 Tax=Parvularcula sp. IMCC14364 TaxID=3067902 RepID=UPI0027420A5B|nr:hypothetical protein [Parvularcula sp. IMCC14364]
MTKMEPGNEHIENLIDAYLAWLKEDGRSAPAGIYWQRVWDMIVRDVERQHRPRLPLVLSGMWYSSHQDKQDRLKEHLLFSFNRGKLFHALAMLERIPSEGWCHVQPERENDWNRPMADEAQFEDWDENDG